MIYPKSNAHWFGVPAGVYNAAALMTKWEIRPYGSGKGSFCDDGVSNHNILITVWPNRSDRTCPEINCFRTIKLIHKDSISIIWLNDLTISTIEGIESQAPPHIIRDLQRNPWLDGPEGRWWSGLSCKSSTGWSEDKGAWTLWSNNTPKWLFHWWQNKSRT